jgi:hypothetical protein
LSCGHLWRYCDFKKNSSPKVGQGQSSCFDDSAGVIIVGGNPTLLLLLFCFDASGFGLNRDPGRTRRGQEHHLQSPGLHKAPPQNNGKGCQFLNPEIIFKLQEN